MADDNINYNYPPDGKSVGFVTEFNNEKVPDTLPGVVPTTAEGYSIYSNLKDGKVSDVSHRSNMRIYCKEGVSNLYPFARLSYRPVSNTRLRSMVLFRSVHAPLCLWFMPSWCWQGK